MIALTVSESSMTSTLNMTFFLIRLGRFNASVWNEWRAATLFSIIPPRGYGVVTAPNAMTLYSATNGEPEAKIHFP
jgi:hypothetical protein